MSELGALLCAVYAGESVKAKSLLAHRPSLAQRFSRGPDQDGFDRDVGAIHLAAFSGNIQLMAVLIDRGADANAHGEAGTPLFQAIVGKQTEAARWLLERGARADYCHPNGETALHIAAVVGDTVTTEALLKRGADPNAKTTQGVTETLPGSPPVMGETPLHLAAAYGHLAVVQQLIQGGADWSITDHVGAATEHWAGRYRQEEIRRWLSARTHSL